MLRDFRQDLWQRIRYNQILVPSLSAYAIANRTQIIRSIHRQFQDQARNEIQRLDELGKGLDVEICSGEWRIRLGRIDKQELTREIEAEMARLDVRAIGEFRGLRNVILRVILGSSVRDAAETIQRELMEETQGDQSREARDLDILAKALASDSLSIAWKKQRSDWAARINTLLKAHDHQVERLIRDSGKERHEIKKQLENMLRSE
jgi:hypothetical protein